MLASDDRYVFVAVQQALREYDNSVARNVRCRFKGKLTAVMRKPKAVMSHETRSRHFCLASMDNARSRGSNTITVPSLEMTMHVPHVHRSLTIDLSNFQHHASSAVPHLTVSPPTAATN